MKSIKILKCALCACSSLSQVVSTAHSVGLATTSTIMFGAVEDGPPSWAKHLLHLRALAARTGGISEFVPLPFVHMEAPIYLKVISDAVSGIQKI